MIDSSCLYNECDSWCHPTLCGIKMFLQKVHEKNLENSGHIDLVSYASLTDIACNKCEGCGYVDCRIASKQQHDEVEHQDYRHPLNVMLPEPLESYKIALEVKRETLLSRYRKLKKELEDTARDFKETFEEEIDNDEHPTEDC